MIPTPVNSLLLEDDTEGSQRSYHRKVAVEERKARRDDSHASVMHLCPDGGGKLGSEDSTMAISCATLPQGGWSSLCTGDQVL